MHFEDGWVGVSGKVFGASVGRKAFATRAPCRLSKTGFLRGFVSRVWQVRALCRHAPNMCVLEPTSCSRLEQSHSNAHLFVQCLKVR